MIGIGRIYEMYRDGIIESDDEVAVTFDGETNEPLSIPLVNIRFTVKAALDAGILREEQAAAFMDTARKTFYPTGITAIFSVNVKKTGLLRVPLRKTCLIFSIRTRSM